MTTCDLQLIRQREDGRYVHRCRNCQAEIASRYAEGHLRKRQCVKPRPPGGVGTELKAIFESLGFSPKRTCGCNKLAARMDYVGPEGVDAAFDYFAAELRKRYDTTTTGEWVTAAVASFWTGVAFNVNPLDPVPGVLSMAIARAKEKQ